MSRPGEQGPVAEADGGVGGQGVEELAAVAGGQADGLALAGVGRGLDEVRVGRIRSPGRGPKNGRGPPGRTSGRRAWAGSTPNRSPDAETWTGPFAPVGRPRQYRRTWAGLRWSTSPSRISLEGGARALAVGRVPVVGWVASPGTLPFGQR